MQVSIQINIPRTDDPSRIHEPREIAGILRGLADSIERAPRNLPGAVSQTIFDVNHQPCGRILIEQGESNGNG